MEAKTELIISEEGEVMITTAEYSSLIACRTMLDMILASAKDSTYGSADSAVVKCAGKVRSLMPDFLILDTPKTDPEGEDDA